MSAIFAAEVCALLAAVSLSAGNPHYSREGCAECHVMPGKNISQTAVSAGSLIGDAREICLRCHPDGDKSHPTGVKAARNTLNLPLDSEGRVTCVTCHVMHPVLSKEERPALLRKEFNTLCFSCHDK